MRAMWGESIDRDSENRDYLRVGELKAAASVDEMVFPPLCPTCLTPNPQGVYAITIREGYQAGLLHPIYIPHCKRCPVREGLFRGNKAVWIGLAVCLAFAVAMLLFINPFWPQVKVTNELGEEAWVAGTELIDWGAFIGWPYLPFFWLAVVGVVFCGYLIQQRGIWVHAINEDTVVFGFKHPGYCDEFRRANRISGVRKSAEELSDWEARLCPHCQRPLQRGQELCSFCGRRVPERAAAGRVQAAARVKGPPEVESGGDEVAAAAQETMEALAGRTTAGGVAIEQWPKTIRCQCGRKYRIRHPGTYHCVDPHCGRTFIAE